jgi:hypothetical protein
MNNAYLLAVLVGAGANTGEASGVIALGAMARAGILSCRDSDEWRTTKSQVVTSSKIRTTIGYHKDIKVPQPLA